MIGLLWFDDSKRPLLEKVSSAVAGYARKYHQRPDWCYIHPCDLGDEITVDGVRVSEMDTVLKLHFWLGLDADG